MISLVSHHHDLWVLSHRRLLRKPKDRTFPRITDSLSESIRDGDHQDDLAHHQRLQHPISIWLSSFLFQASWKRLCTSSYSAWGSHRGSHLSSHWLLSHSFLWMWWMLHHSRMEWSLCDLLSRCFCRSIRGFQKWRRKSLTLVEETLKLRSSFDLLPEYRQFFSLSFFSSQFCFIFALIFPGVSFSLTHDLMSHP